MEESLKRLKQARRTATSNPVGTNGGMSDDNKIRLQLALDVEYFGEQVSYEKQICLLLLLVLEGSETEEKKEA